MKDTWSHRYEQVRHDALQRGSRKSAGMALLMRQGISRWMESWSNLAPRSAVDHRGPLPVAHDLKADLAEVVIVMAGMLMEASA